MDGDVVGQCLLVSVCTPLANATPAYRLGLTGGVNPEHAWHGMLLLCLLLLACARVSVLSIQHGFCPVVSGISSSACIRCPFARTRFVARGLFAVRLLAYRFDSIGLPSLHCVCLAYNLNARFVPVKHLVRASYCSLSR